LTLISLSSGQAQPIVILVEDVPLKAQVGARMAAEFGSRVKVEQTELAANSILVSGWEFWRLHAQNLPTPHLVIIATLPIPSLEHPLVAGRVAYYKQTHKDWFRFYLLPTALREIQRAVSPISPSQGVVALLDNRVNHRSYGRQILGALEPFARTNYLTPDWFDPESSENLE
jgi:ATP-dependent DNA helicase DinG